MIKNTKINSNNSNKTIIFIIFCLFIQIFILTGCGNNEQIKLINTKQMIIPRKSFSTVELKNGKVLITGGEGKSGDLSSSEIFDPINSQFNKISNMTEPRVAHRATLLKDGKVLITGGTAIKKNNYSLTNKFNIAEPKCLKSAEIFDPNKNTFIKTSDMKEVRYGHNATLLKDGKVLITGGNAPNKILNTAEIYDPVKNKFYATGNMIEKRSAHTTTLLDDGRVLITGGATSKACEIYNPTTGKFFKLKDLIEYRRGHKAFLLSNGNVLIVGGFINSRNTPDYGRFELFNPTTNSFISYGHMIKNRLNSNSIMLENGKLFIVGGEIQKGFFEFKDLNDGEIFDPKNKTSQLINFGWFGYGYNKYDLQLLPNRNVALFGDSEVKIFRVK